jgi:DNA topoisomerase VI subunit B
LLWSKMSTGMPMQIRSSLGTSKPVSEVDLDLDVFSNSPNIHRHEKVENKDKWRGSQIKVTIGGEFSKYRRYVINYLREMAVITPYARFEMHYRAEDPSKSFDIVHSRRSEVMPPPPSKAKVHPASVDNSVLDNLLRTTPQKTLLRFLTSELDAVDKKTALQLIDDLGSPFSADMDVRTIDTSKVRKMVDKINRMEFDPPSGKVLSPAGEYNLHLGVMKEMRPDMIATSTQDVTVVDGHAVLVEAAVALGGRRAKEGIHVHRFANRIPMLFQQGNDVSVRTANARINWKSYRIDKNTQKIGVYISICSTKIPYGGPNKEYIGDENEDLQKVVRDAIMKCCVQLKSRLARAEWIKNQKDRKKNLEKYIPHVARALSSLIQTISEESPVAGDQAPEKIRKVVELHRQKQVTEGILQQKLRIFVEEADMEQALASSQVIYILSLLRKYILLNRSRFFSKIKPELSARMSSSPCSPMVRGSPPMCTRRSESSDSWVRAKLPRELASIPARNSLIIISEKLSWSRTGQEIRNLCNPDQERTPASNHHQGILIPLSDSHQPALHSRRIVKNSQHRFPCPSARLARICRAVWFSVVDRRRAK